MKHEVIFGSDVSVRAKSKAVVVKTTGCLNLAATTYDNAVTKSYEVRQS